ncbi:signal peptidase I [Actinospica robiniae]|uniref:signal peptidase I n=1 Tax=Actinospica robiniae TaxID=304901 RepID=UPI000409F0B9|nr:signal peptidase I [Actinospica robiniae]
MARGQRRREAPPAAPVKGRRRRLKPIKLWREVPLLLAIALVLALGIKTFVVQAFYIPSPSMENTIMPGDRVLVNKFSPWFGAQPQRGEVVVFNDPGGWLDDSPTPPSSDFAVRWVTDTFTFVGLLPSSNEHDLIKRVIGVPGDEVKCCDKQGRITVNGVALSETGYIFPGAVPSTMPFDVRVKAGFIWVMGDNRADSADSRYHVHDKFGGMVPISDVVGHAFVLIWPPSRAGGLGIPATFQQEGLTVLSTVPTGSVPAAALLGAIPLRLAGGRTARRLRRRRSRAQDVTADGTDAEKA